jgi:hypothetical protein
MELGHAIAGGDGEESGIDFGEEEGRLEFLMIDFERDSDRTSENLKSQSLGEAAFPDMTDVRRRANAGAKDDTGISDSGNAASASKTRSSSSKSSFNLVNLLLAVIGLLVFLIVTAVSFIVIQNGGIGGDPFPDFAKDFGPPRQSELEVVADLPSPPGNLAVDANGRVFFTFHPQYSFPTRVAEYLVEEKRWIPFPADQSIFSTV